MAALLLLIMFCSSSVYALPQVLSLADQDVPFLRPRRSADLDATRHCSSNISEFSECANDANRAYRVPLEYVYNRMRRGQAIDITHAGFQQFCNDHRERPDCITKLPQQCRPSRKSEYELIRDAVTIGCSREQAILSLQSHRCRGSVNPALDNEQCMWAVIRRAVRDLGEMGFRTVMMERNASYCPYLRQSRDCILSTLTSWCGGEITAVLTPILHELIFSSWELQFQEYNCSTTSLPATTTGQT